MKTSKLEEILGIDFPQECKISSVTNTSKKIKKGSIFFGLQGTNEHGSNYALEALDIGASFVVHNDKNLQTNNKKIFYIENLENKIVKFLDSFYGININNNNFFAFTGTMEKHLQPFLVINYLPVWDMNQFILGPLG